MATRVAGLPSVCAAIYWVVASTSNDRLHSAETKVLSAPPANKNDCNFILDLGLIRSVLGGGIG